ncbi:MAG: ATP-binding protein [Byssovorax sp.]
MDLDRPPSKRTPSTDRAVEPSPPRVTALGAFIGWFIPADLAEPAEVDRVRLSVATAWVMVGILLILAVIHAIARNGREAAINVGLALGIACGPFALRAGVPPRRVLSVVLAACLAGTGSLVLVHGAGVNPATVAIAEIPIYATLLGGIRFGAVWAVLAGLAGLAVGVLGHAGLIPPTSEPGTRLFNEHAALLVITGTLFLVAALYEIGRHRALDRIAALDARHLAVERERMEAVMAAHSARTERLASLGRIAAAAAHEINNPLSYVSNNLEFAEQALARLAGQAEVIQALAEARDGVERIRRIVLDLKGAARPGDDVIGSVDLARALETAIKMAEGHTRSRARVLTTIGDPRHVVGNEGRLVQVFLNLLVNAAQAIPEGQASQHAIQVRTRASDDRVVIEIEDSGAGMSADVLARAKEPFFTTKLGEGLGLGLALAHGILESVGGTLYFDSKPGCTIARVTLAASGGVSEIDAAKAPAPLSPVVAVAVAPTEPKETAREATLVVDETFEVLVIDDEPLVARALARGLRPHRVTTTQSGREALALLAEGKRFDLIVCDMMMPELTGMDVHEEIARLYPDALPHLAFISGGSFTERAEEFLARVTVPLLDKPVDFAKIRALLQERARRPRSISPRS